ncbi:AsmA family protein [Marinihelvus fidelis]|uniref:AsmA family protein n=1 Tax=Marinihelvus fidelis TaxID=2613842 RepID=A0A5N0T6S4_9GAMM|nr:AsmA family protein [Marinihelvus fidelis]KAA9130174.1 AsmA family protein [Marinihelvus fidelis]
MSRRRTILLITAATLVLLIGGLVAWLLTSDLGRFRATFESGLSSRLGRQVSFDQSLSVHLGRHLRIAAAGVRVANPEWAEHDDMLTIERVELQLNMLSLFRQPVRVIELNARGVRLNVEQDEARRSNIPGVDTQGDRAAEQQGGEPGPLPVVFEHVELSGFEMAWSSPTRDTPLLVSVNTLIQRLDDSRNIEVQLAGNVNQLPVRFSGRVDSIDTLLTGRDVVFNGEGRVGDVHFSGHVHADDLARPRQPTFDLRLDGDDFGQVALLVGRPAPAGAFSLQAVSQRVGDAIEMTLDGRIDEITLQADVATSDLSDPRQLGLEVAANGPRLGKLAEFFGLGEWPMLPFELQGRLKRSDRQLDIESSSLVVGGARLEVDWQLPKLPTLAGGQGHASLEGDDLAAFSRLMGGRGRVEGAFRADLALVSADDGSGTIRGHLETSLGDITVSGTPGDGPHLVGSELNLVFNGNSADAVLQWFGVNGFAPEPFRLSAGATIGADHVDITEGASIEMRGSRLRFDGRLPTTGNLHGTHLNFGLDGEDLPAVAPGLGSALPGGALTVIGELQFDDQVLRVNGLELVTDDVAVKANIALDMPIASSTGQFDITVHTDAPDRLVAQQWPATLSPQPLDLVARGYARSGEWDIDQARLQFGPSSLALRGRIGAYPGFRNSALTLDIESPGLDQLGQWGGRPLPGLPMRLSTQLVGSPRVFGLTGLTAVLGETDLAGTVNVRLDGDRPELRASLASKVLDLVQLAGAKNPESQAADPLPRKPGLPFDDTRLPLQPLALLNMDLDYSADVLKLESRQFRSLSFHARLADSALVVDSLHAVGLAGDMRGGFSIRPRAEESGSADVSVNATASGLRFNLSRDLVPDPNALPTMDYEINANGHGSTLYQFLEHLEGSFYAEVGSGEVPDSVLAVFDVGLLEQVFNTILPGRVSDPTTRLACAGAHFVARDGVLRSEPGMMLVTDKVRMFSQGEVNLGDGGIDLSFESYANRIYQTNITEVLVNPYIRFTGTLAQPRLGLDTKKAVFSAGLAIGTSGLSILARELLGSAQRSTDPCADNLAILRKSRPSPSAGNPDDND